MKLLWLSLLLLQNCATPSSEVPERREFPITESIAPCQDFYGHVCQGVTSQYSLREDRSIHTFAFNDSAERLLIAKTKFLKELDAASTPRRQQLKNNFSACLNQPERLKEEKELVRATLEESAAWTKDRSVFLKELASHIDGEKTSLIGFGTAANQDNPDWYDVYFLAGFKSLPEHSYYENKELMQEFAKLLSDFFATLGLDDPTGRAERLIATEQRLIKTYPKPAEFREIFSTKRMISRSDLVKKYPHFHLDVFMPKIPQNIKIRNLTPANFDDLHALVQTIPLEDLRSFYLYRELSSLMDVAYPEYFAKKFAFQNRFLGGPQKRPELEERCTRMLTSKFTKEIDAEMVDQVFPNFPAEKIVALSEKVRGAIIDGLKSNTWLSPQGRAKATEKIKTASLMLVKPRNDKEWDFNLPADYSATRPLANDRLYAKMENKKALLELQSKRDRSKWFMGPLTINAYYYPANNQFVLPIGILQYPFYHSMLDETTNLGAVGAVIGHELGHAIDDKGSRYDAKGRLLSILSEADLKNFSQRSQRFVDQFAQAGFDGRLTLGENIGDHVGLSFAYAAAFPQQKPIDRERHKAFFIQYARLWCQVVRPSYRELLLKTDPHPAGQARVNEQVKHQPGFADAFGCKKGDPMVAADPIRVW